MVNKSWHGGTLSCQAENIAGSSDLSSEKLNVFGRSIDLLVKQFDAFTERSVKIGGKNLYKFKKSHLLKTFLNTLARPLYFTLKN